ncbi:MAG: DUF1553 domain-containing protein, partial [Candidatus Omnitrophica bacterium]|nr:DUF1553 domain-containing protein [Candidatus Omnitrophota bacterium]
DPHFGERWGRHWLDLARYADSDGYEFDKERPTAYPYRDAVIRAMNEDLPFDTFLKWQLAGDEIEPDNPLARALTGFCASGPTIDNQVLEKNRYDELDDILVTTCSSMLALTVGCARCHDHKFEPISMRDYYRILAFFNTTKREEIHLATRIEADAARKREGELTKRQVEARAALDQFVSPFRTPIFESKLASLPINATEQNLLRAPEDPANPPQRMLLDLYRQAIRVTDDELVASMTESRQIRWETLKEAVANLEKELAELPTKCLTVTDSQAEPLPAYFLARGDPDQKQGEVQPGFLSVLRRIGAEERPVHIPVPDGAVTTHRRRALAEWITDVESGAGHLAARVIANRLWRHHFGEGLVRTPSDFGMQGDRPSHPGLLDWLAGELIRGGWKLKPIHRLLARSSVYRLGTEFDEGKAAQDPENRLLWRRRPVRLEAEPIRDAILAVSGKLNDEMYGPGIHPKVPREAIATGSTYKWPVDVVDGPDTWRRSIYIFMRRSAVFPMLTVFDGTDATASCARRTATTVPLQALELLNNDFAREQAGYFAERARARVD